MNKKLLLPLFTRAAITENSYNETDGTIEIVFATETPVKRRGWNGESYVNYLEILECQSKNVRLERANAGANLVDSHQTYSVKTVIGVVIRAWVENKQCKAIIKLSAREDVKGTVKDIVDGIVRNVSVGYDIHATDTSEDANGNITVRVSDWEPAEISMVTVPADFNSGTRSQEIKENTYEINFNTRNMPPEVTPEAAAPEGQRAAQPVATPVTVTAPVAVNESTIRMAERTRIADINTAVRAAGIDEEGFAQGLVDSGSSLEAARSAILDKVIEKQGAVTRTATPVVGVLGDDERVKTRMALEEVLAHRTNPSIALVSDKAKELRHASLLDMAMISLEARGEKASLGSMSKGELVKRALSTSDYPLMLGNTVNRALRASYEAVTPEWRRFASARSASDFKAISSVGVGGDFKLKKLTEGGEYKQVKMDETGDSFKLDTYGRMISITRHAIINDDLGGFMRYTQLFGRGAMELQSEIVYGLLTANSGGGRKLSDGKNLFHADHKNLAASGSVLSIASLTAARLAMRRQTGLTGEKILVRPRFLVVPPELETLAYQLIAAETANTVVGEANPFKGAFEVLVDPFLESATSWYLMADPGTIPVVEYAFLNGQEGLYTEQEVDFNTDNLNIKVRTDFAATIEEFRGVYKNPGA